MSCSLVPQQLLVLFLFLLSSHDFFAGIYSVNLYLNLTILVPYGLPTTHTHWRVSNTYVSCLFVVHSSAEIAIYYYATRCCSSGPGICRLLHLRKFFFLSILSYPRPDYCSGGLWAGYELVLLQRGQRRWNKYRVFYMQQPRLRSQQAQGKPTC